MADRTPSNNPVASIPQWEVNAVGEELFDIHEAIKALNKLLEGAGRDHGVDCLELYCLLWMFEQNIFTALDMIGPYADLGAPPRGRSNVPFQRRKARS